MENMGMAPTPEQLNRLHQAQITKPTEGKKKKGKGQRPFVRVTADSPLLKQEVQQILFGVHWQYQKRILDMMKIVTDPSKWDVVRTITMDIQNEQVETQRVLIGQRITDYIIKENKENENGYQES